MNPNIKNSKRERGENIVNTDYRDTNEKQNRLLVTMIGGIRKGKINVGHGELDDPAQPPVLLPHGVHEKMQVWSAMEPVLAESSRTVSLAWRWR